MRIRPFSIRGVLYALYYTWRLVFAGLAKWVDDECPRYGASLSYYTVLSLAPLLVILVGVIGMFFGEGTAHEQLVGEAARLAGPKAAEIVNALLVATNKRAEGLTASLLAVGMLLVGATGVLVELRKALDHIWFSPYPEKRRGSVWGAIVHVVLTRMLTFGILFAIGFLMVMSLLVSAYMAALERWVDNQMAGMLASARVLNPLLSVGVLTVLFAFLMFGLPTRKPSWRIAIPAAAIAALLFTAGKSLIGIYLGATSTTSVYGAAGSLVALMVWVYYSSQIVLLGAEFAWVMHATPKGEFPGSAAYLKVYHEALSLRQHQIRLHEEASQATDAAVDGQAR
ncbi:MAG: YihY/virulence factor BrkB family protein [Brachymonas sp.]|nr:YihY/virulence factor BrkB family protein [Brachymonas sp.]